MDSVEWEPVATCYEGDVVVLLGVNPWAHEWARVASWGPVEVRHPEYPDEKHSAWRYEVPGPTGVVEFAAAELSNNVWGFYLRGSRREV